MQNHQRIALFEAALTMELATRCERAYRHDLKNSLQAIHAGVEVLIRTITTGSDKPAERIITFAKNAVAQQTTTIESLFNMVIAADTSSEPVDINTLIQKCASFLRQDAFEHNVKIELQLCAAATAQVRMMKMRLVFLALITDAIDALTAGGRILITNSSQNNEIVIEIHDSRQASHETTWIDDLSTLDIEGASARLTLMPTVVRYLVEIEGGRVEHHLNASGRLIRIRFPEIAL